MANNLYLALLRGINVGGNNIIKMDKLKSWFEDMGFADVKTYIQSGNVIISSGIGSEEAVTKKIEKGLAEKHGKQIPVVVVPYSDLKKVIDDAPKGFGTDKDNYKYDVIFIRNPMTVAKAFPQIEFNPDVDAKYKGKRVMYFSRKTSKLTKSRLNKLVGSKLYQHLTIRNWNTTSRLLELLEELKQMS